MYLSRVTFPLSDRTGLSIAADRYAAHRFVAAAFNDCGPARPLFRLMLADDQAQLLVQSGVEPDWMRARNYHGSDGDWHAEVKEFPRPPLQGGERLCFLLLANVVKTIRPDPGQGQEKAAKAVRVPLIRDDQLLRWFRDQGEKGGFLPLSVRVIPQRDRVHMRTGKDRKPIILCGAEFQGVIQVKDGYLLWTTVENGLGHGKAFGFGLLSIAPDARGR